MTNQNKNDIAPMCFNKYITSIKNEGICKDVLITKINQFFKDYEEVMVFPQDLKQTYSGEIIFKYNGKLTPQCLLNFEKQFNVTVELTNSYIECSTE